MPAIQDAEFETRLLAAIRTGLRKARELGYDVEQMDVTASPCEGLWAVHFGPLEVPGTITTGGDLSLTVDPYTEQVIDFKRGQ